MLLKFIPADVFTFFNVAIRKYKISPASYIVSPSNSAVWSKRESWTFIYRNNCFFRCKCQDHDYKMTLSHLSYLVTGSWNFSPELQSEQDARLFLSFCPATQLPGFSSWASWLSNKRQLLRPPAPPHHTTELKARRTGLLPFLRFPPQTSPCMCWPELCDMATPC